MKRGNIIKSFFLAGALCLVGGFAACNTNGSAPEREFTGFLPGVAVEVPRGDILFLEEFIDYTDANYTITLEQVGGDASDVTDKKRIPINEPGEYTLTYTVLGGEHAGTYVHTFVVPYATLQWAYTSDPIDIQYQTEFKFEDLFQSLNLAVMSHTKTQWNAFIKNIRIGDNIIEVDKDSTSFYINSLETHYITYGVETVDGQKGMSVATANVYFSDTVSNVYLNSLSTGNHEIAVQGATAVSINGKACTEVTIESDKLVFDKQTLYKKYAGTNFLSITTANGEVRDTLNVYTDKISFEEDLFMSPDFLRVYDEQMGVDNSNKRIVDKFVTNGNKALEITTSSYFWPRFSLRFEYLDMIFSDPEVNALIFDITYAGKTEQQSYRDLTLEGVFGVRLERNQAKTVTIAREKYEQFKADVALALADPGNMDYPREVRIGAMISAWPMTLQNSRDAVGGTDAYAKLYFDNFRAVSQLPAQTYAVNDTAEGDLIVDVAGVTAVVMNGVAVPEDKLQITSNYAVIDKDWLFTHVGTNVLEVSTANKTYELTVNIYQLNNDFEDGTVPAFITSSVGTMSVANYNDSKALKFYVGEGQAQWPQFTIANEYLKLVFADGKGSALTKLTWDVSMEFVPRSMDANDNNPADFIGLTTTPAVLSSVGFRSGEKKTFTITKTLYDALEGKDLIFTWMNQWANTGCAALTWYIDNIQIGVDEQAVLVDFNNGSPMISGYTTLGNGSAIQSYYGSTASDSTQKTGYSGVNTDQRILFQTAGGVTGEEGDKSLAFNFQWKCPDVWKVGFAIAWLDEVFSDQNITAMQWSMKTAADSRITGISTDVAQSWTRSFKADNTWHTLTMTRADYNAIKNAASLEVADFLTISLNKNESNYNAAFWWLFDEFKVFTTEIQVPDGNEPDGNEPTVDETALTLNFNELALGAVDATKYYLSSNVTGDDSVVVDKHGYGEFVNNDTSADEKALKFYMSANTARQYMYVNVVLTEAMKSAIANGAGLSFTYAINRCVSSQYTMFNLSAGANGGSATQALFSSTNVGYDSAGNTWGPRKVDSAGAAFEQWQTLTITDATVLSELASTGILQITIDAYNWNKKHETNFWIDNITVVNV